MFISKNNFIFSPVKLGYCYENDGMVNQRHLDFYDVRTKHIGSVAYEPLYLSKNLRELPSQLGIDSSDKIAGLKKLNNIVHKNGAKAIAHLNHPGRMVNPKISGNYLVSSSNKICPMREVAPRKMNTTDIQLAIELFVEGAKRAEESDFDAIEIQFGYGYLVAQFLSSSVNDRTDDYGGSFENRSRFAFELLDSVKQSVNLPIFVRMTGSEMTPNGIDLKEAVQLAKILKTKDIEAAHIVAGSVCDSLPWFFQHMFVPKGKTWELAKKIKDETGIKVISSGRINSTEDIKKLKEFQSDYIAMARPLIADPDVVGKLLGIVDGNIRPCLACSEFCVGGVRLGKGLQCVVNPIAGRENYVFKPVDKSKNIAVIGGGLAGMESAIQLNKRGHKVTIFEKGELGGQFNLAYLLQKKESLSGIIEYYKQEIKDRKIEVIFKEITSTDILNKGFDEIVIATGSVPIQPNIKGLKIFHWADIIKNDDYLVNQKIVVIGGGLIGLEIANKYINNNIVIVVEALDEVGRGMEMMEKNLTLKNLKDNNVTILTNQKVTEVIDDGRTILLSDEKIKKIENIDLIITTVGMISNNKLKDELQGKINCHVIGDAVIPTNAGTAILNGFELGSKL